MSSLKLELRQMILKEMRKREFGESKNPTWDNSNSRLIDIINEEMIPSEEAPFDDGYMSSEPAGWGEDFDVWNPDQAAPEDNDWGFSASPEAVGVPVEPGVVDRLTTAVSDILHRPMSDFGATDHSGALGRILGKLASTIESINSNAPDASRGSVNSEDIASLESIVSGADAEVLSQEAPEVLRNAHELLRGVA